MKSCYQKVRIPLSLGCLTVCMIKRHKEAEQVLGFPKPRLPASEKGQDPQGFRWPNRWLRPHRPTDSTHVPTKEKTPSLCGLNRAQGLDLAGQCYRRKWQANFVWNSELKFHSANKTQYQIKSKLFPLIKEGPPGEFTRVQRGGKLNGMLQRTVKAVDYFHRCQGGAQYIYGKCLMKNAVHTPQRKDDDNPLQNSENQRPKIFSIEKH